MTDLPADALLIELRPDSLTFATRTAFLPGTVMALALMLEGHALDLEAPVDVCMVVDMDKKGYTFHCRLSLAGIANADHLIVNLFIGKGRGSPDLMRSRRKRT